MPSKIFNQLYNMFATLLVSHKWDPALYQPKKAFSLTDSTQYTHSTHTEYNFGWTGRMGVFVQ